MLHDNMRGLIINDRITFFGLVTLKHILNDDERELADHLSKICLTESETTQFLRKVQKLIGNKITIKCPDQL